MAIGFRASSTGNVHTPGSTIVITKPTNTADYDVMVVAFSAGLNSASAVGSWDAPAGWTLVGQLHNQVVGSNRISVDVYWSLGSNANLTFTKNGTVQDAGWACVSFSYVDKTTAVDATGTPNSATTATTLTTNAVTVVNAEAWHCIGFGDWNGGTFSATGFTNVENSAVNESAAILYNITPKSAGSTGTVIVTSSASGTGQVLVGVPFALRPEPFPVAYEKVIGNPQLNTLIRL